VIVNTCSFIDAATEESIDTVLEMSEARSRGWQGKLVVTGCMAQRHHESLRAAMPEVDAFVGTGDYHRILDVVGTGSAQKDIVGEPVYVQGAEARVNTLTPWSAYLKILEGCPQRCTFCIIPRLRGDLMSRPMDVLLNEARALAAAGVKELNLVGQDSNSWGRDLGKSERLPELLRGLDGVDGIEWLRLLYSYPAKFNDDLIDAFVALDKVVPYIDMPLQHINDQVLKRMQRRVNRERTIELVDKLRSRIPNLVMRTTFIAGFPGETEEQFEELKDFVTEARFERMGVFTYSREPDTPADRLPDHLPEELKLARQEELMAIQQPIAFEFLDSLVGYELDVLIDQQLEDNLWLGRTYADAPEIDGNIYVSGNEVSVGDLIPVEIIERRDYDLVGIHETDSSESE